MAEESKETESVPLTTSGEESGGTPTSPTNIDNRKGGGEGGDRDRTPVEELYDLSKPIKKVDKPNKEEHEAELARLTESIEEFKTKRREIQTKIDDTMDSSRSSEVNVARDELTRLRRKKGDLIGEKKSIRARLDKTRNVSERLFEDKRRTKDTMKFTSLQEIEEELKRLQRRQETTSMSLSEEKRLIKEMDALQASKKLVATLKTKETDLEDAREQRKLISAEIAAKDKEIDAVAAEIEEKSEALKSLSDKETDSRSVMQAMFSERDEIKKKLNDLHQEKDAARAAFREANNKWYDFQRALRAQRRMRIEEEKRKKEDERLALLKAQEEEEMKKVPYEEEMALCDYLAEYLTKTYLSDKQQKNQDQQQQKKNDVVEVKDDPFAGFKPMKKKNDDEVYLKMGAGKKPRQRKSKKKKNDPKLLPFTLNVDSFEQFGLLNLTPPTSYEMVEPSVEELRAKKKWYSEQPRGSIPTIMDIRKENERKAAMLRSTQEDQQSEKPKSVKKGGFSLSKDDFVPLGGGTGQQDTTVNSTWVHKPSEEQLSKTVAEKSDDVPSEPVEEKDAQEEDTKEAVAVETSS